MVKTTTFKHACALCILSVTVAVSPAADVSERMLNLQNATVSESVLVKAPAEFVRESVANTDNLPRKVKRDSGGMTWTILMEEDFSGFAEGSIQEPWSNPLCNFYGEPGPYIDPLLTQQPGWTGTNVFSAGGAVILKEYSPMMGAVLNTPLGDYSGNITVSFKYKIAPGYDQSSLVYVNVAKGGLADPEMADCDDNVFQCNVYPWQEEWRYAEFSCLNKSADNDGFIQFTGYGNIVIDDIKVMSSHDYIAPPKLKPISDFTPTSFRANWEPVRLASFYHVELMKKVYTSDEGIYMELDFEDLNEVPDGWVIPDFSPDKIVEGGENNSKGYKMTGGDYIITPNVDAKYKWMKLFGSLVIPENFQEGNPFAGYVQFSLLGDDGWVQLTEAPISWFYDPWNINLAEMFAGFADNYYSVKIELVDMGMGEGPYLVLDNIEIETNRQTSFEPIITAADYEYVSAAQTYYDFVGLESDAEYYYSVKSFYMGMMSEPVTEHAFGVSSPLLLPASNVTKSSYVANWERAPKATRYVVTNYGVYNSPSDSEDYSILNEDFVKVDSEYTVSSSLADADPIDNYIECNLDAYTSLPGWTGLGNCIFKGGIGVINSIYETYYIQTPPLDLSNNDKFKLSLLGQIMQDDNLQVFINGKNYIIPLQAGEFSGEYLFEESGSDLVIAFYTANGTSFGLEYVDFSQDIKGGQKVFTFLGSEEVDGSTTSVEFSGLTTDFSNYAFNVKSVFDYEGAVAYSAPGDKMFVTLDNSSVITNVIETSLTRRIIEWYSIDGCLINGPKPGICIVKYDDGSFEKRVIKQ